MTLDKLAQRYGQTPDRIRDADASVLKVANTADLLIPPPPKPKGKQP